MENRSHARVAVVTDRDELDKQIERVFHDANETPYQAKSGRDLMATLGKASPRLICSLVHKFGLDARGKSRKEFEAFIEELGFEPSSVAGQLFVFVDECHRSQSDRLHKAMKALLPRGGVHRLYRHAAVEEGQGHQPGGVRRLHAHLHLRRGGARRGGAGSGVRGARYRPDAGLHGTSTSGSRPRRPD